VLLKKPFFNVGGKSQNITDLDGSVKIFRETSKLHYLSHPKFKD
jgi:hypothetical protein